MEESILEIRIVDYITFLFEVKNGSQLDYLVYGHGYYRKKSIVWSSPKTITLFDIQNEYYFEFVPDYKIHKLRQLQDVLFSRLDINGNLETKNFDSELDGDSELYTLNMKDNTEETSNSVDFLDAIGKINAIVTVSAAVAENNVGSFRYKTVKKGFSFKYYGTGWRGNQYAKTYRLSTIGKVGGIAAFGIGLGLDTAKFYNGEMSGQKYGLNVFMGALGFSGFGLPASLTYGLIESFYPNGVRGVMIDNGSAQSVYRQHHNGAVIKPRL